MSFEIITTIGAGVAISTLVSVLYETTKSYLRIKELTSSFEDKVEEDPLSSGNIDTIGKYIYEDVGAIKLKDFTLNRVTEDKLNMIINRVEDFFGDTDEEISEPHQPELTSKINLSGLPDEYDVFLNELRRGELWNCLAKLRLFTEQKLAMLLDLDGSDVRKHRSPRQLLKSLYVAQKIDQEVSSHLDYVLTVANRAIHGEEVDDDIALEAVQSAIVAFQQINKKANNAQQTIPDTPPAK